MEPTQRAHVDRIRRRFTTAVVCCAALAPLVASAFERTHVFSPLPRNEELAQHSVHAVLQDRNGLLWIGTQGGLHRFDGHELVLYHHQSERRDSLPDNFVTALAETADGQLIVGTARGDVVRMDPAHGTFQPVEPNNDRPTPRLEVVRLVADAEQGLWVGSRSALERIDANGRAQVITGPDDKPLSLVSDLSLCGDGHMLVATKSGAFRLAPNKLRAAPIDMPAGESAHAVHCARAGSQWVASNNALYHFTGGSLQLRWRIDANDVGHVTDIAEDVRGTLWLARHGVGLVEVDPDGDVDQLLRHEPNVPGSLPEDTVRTLYVDRSGLLWIGGELRGLYSTEPAGTPFTYLFDETLATRDVTANNIRALLADGSDGLWIGAQDGGLRRYDFGQRQFRHFAVSLRTAADLPAENPEMVAALADAGQGKLWVGSVFGLARVDPENGVIERVPSDPSRHDALPGRNVRALAIGNDGSLWVGTMEGGLSRHDPRSGQWEHFGAASNADTPGLWNAAVVAVHEDRNGRVWIGTLGGLNVFERTTGRLYKIAPLTAQSDGLAGERVRSILEGNDGTLWIGTQSGLNRLLSYENGQAHFRTYRVADGLANDTIYGLLDDAEGRVFAATNRGISMLDPNTDQIINFSDRDGLQGLEFNGGAFARLPDGRIAFGGTQGINLLDPGQYDISRYEAPLAFSTFQIGNRRERIDDPAKFHEIRIQSDDRVVMVAFSALDFANPARNRYRYRLIGYDDQWVDLGGRHEVAFTNLAPGRYTLEVLGSNRDGHFGDRPLTADIVVAPTWWQTGWARGAAGGLLLAAIAIALAIRRRNIAEFRRQHDQLKHFSERLSLALWASRDGFWDWDIVLRRMFLVGPEEFLDGRRETVVSNDFWETKVVHPEDHDRVMAALHAHVNGNTEHYEAEYRVRTATGRVAWVMARGRATARDANGRALRVAGTFRDITEEREHERDRRIAQEVIRSMSEAVCVNGLDFRFVSVNAAFSRITGFADHEVIGHDPGVLNSDQHPPELYAEVRNTLKLRGHWSGELWQRRKDGEQFLSWLEINEVRDASGERTHWVAVLSDITDRKRAEQELRYLANYDTLTGLPNRTLLSERLAHALIRARRLGMKVAVLFLDLDRFKHVNDSLGHAAGDRLLKSAAARIVGSVREADTVARLGGDEFTVILEDLHDGAEAERIAQNLLTAFSQPLDIDGRQEVGITPSIGISLYPEHGQLPTDLLKHADTAMYHAKERGRNTFQIYDDAMDTQVRLRANLASQLQRAMERKELSLVFQPKMSLGENRITGAEALLRWYNGTLGQISPATFIPIAEETGLIVPIGDWVLREACHQIVRWTEAGLTTQSIAVNVSALQLFRGDLVRRLADILAETRVPPHRLELELTESMLMANPEQSISTLSQIKALGVHVSVDDFGTGYSSLAYLKRLPIDTLKIDQTFVGDLTTDPDDEAIVSTVIMMAHSLGLDVIAEGVETNDQLRYLAEQKCDEVQGNLISAPLDADRILHFLIDRRQFASRLRERLGATSDDG